MKLKKGLNLCSMGDEYVVVAENPEVFSGMIKLNKTGAFLFEQLIGEITLSELQNRLTNEYEVSPQTAEEDIKGFIETFVKAGLMENE